MKTRSERRSVFAVWWDTFVLGFKGHALQRVSYMRTLRAKIGLARVKGNTEMRKVVARGPGYRFTFLSFFAFYSADRRARRSRPSCKYRKQR